MADAQPTALERKIDAMIGQLNSKNAGKRREAAYFLGEVAAADAVPALVEVYEKDKDASVRAAAAYALGMYKAVEKAIRAGNEEQVVRLLTGIEEKGKIGKRAPTGQRIRLLLGLTISLIALLIIYGASPNIKARLYGSTRSREEVIAGVQQNFEMVKNDTRALQTELLDVIQGRSLGCIAYYNNPPPYRMDPVDAATFHDISDIVMQMNAAQGSLASAKARYDAACDNQATFGAPEAQSAFQMLLPALQALDPLELALTQAGAQGSAEVQATDVPTVPPPTAVPPPTETPILQPGVELQPTIAPDIVEQANIQPLISGMLNLVDDVSSPRGAGGLLVAYWQDVKDTGSTNGCEANSYPPVPEKVVIPDASAQASPQLVQAAQSVNIGLDAIRSGWNSFQEGCASGTLDSRANGELQNAQVAMQSLEAAQVALKIIQSSS